MPLPKRRALSCGRKAGGDATLQASLVQINMEHSTREVAMLDKLRALGKRLWLYYTTNQMDRRPW